MPDSNELEALRARVQILESELANLKSLLGVSSEPIALTVSRINLVGETGSPAGALYVDKDGAQFQLADTDGNVVFAAGAIAGHGSVTILGGAGQPAIGLKSTDAAAVVSVTNPQGEVHAALISHRGDFEHGSVEVIQNQQRCAVLGTVPGGGSLLLRSRDETHTLVAAASDEGSVLTIHDTGPEPRATIAVGGEMTVFRARGAGETACAASVIGLGGQASVELQNAGGENAMRLLSLEGAGWMSLNDDRGQSRATLGVARDGGTLELSAEEHPHAVLASAGNGGGRLSLQHGDKNAQVVLAAAEDGTNLSLFGPAGKVTASLESNSEGGRVLTATPSGTILGQMASTPTGGAFAVCGPDAKVRGAVWATEDGASCDLYGVDGTRRVGLKAGESGGQLGIMSDSGSPRVALGVAGDHGHCILSASGGDPAVVASATASGGRLVFCDADGDEVLTLPERL